MDDNDIGPSQIVTSSGQQRVFISTGPQKRELMTWRVMLKMFIQSMKYWRDNDFDLVDKQEHKRRYAVCKRCPYLINYRCEKCGCFMFVKSKLAGQTCRDHRW